MKEYIQKPKRTFDENWIPVIFFVYVFVLGEINMGVAVRSGSVWVYFGLLRYPNVRCGSVRYAFHTSTSTLQPLHPSTLDPSIPGWRGGGVEGWRGGGVEGRGGGVEGLRGRGG